MTLVTSYYLSRVIGSRVIQADRHPVGKIRDVVVDTASHPPKVVALKVAMGGRERILDINRFTIAKEKGQYIILAAEELAAVAEAELPQDVLFLAQQVLDRQIVDMNGKKVVRVNDVRLAGLAKGTFAVAVDVGIEGLLRRMGFAKPVKRLLKMVDKRIPSKLIIWDDVETIDNHQLGGIQLSIESSKLATLHPSDLADIIEDLDHQTQMAVFSSLDDEQAADVLEELETQAQLNVLGRMSLEKAADVLENMPADEAADILDEMEDEAAERLLNEMADEVSDEVRELMEYPAHTVGSMMTTDFICFSQELTVDATIRELRRLKPESETVYYLYILDGRERLVGTVSLRDIIISEPDTILMEIMDKKVLYVYDDDNLDFLTKMIAKYNLIALPVVERDMKMAGMVILNDVVDDWVNRRKIKL